MLTTTAVVIFILSVCLTQRSNSCPAACTCTANRKEVHCFEKQLKAIPELQGSNITTLDVSFNNISLILQHDFGNWGRQLKFLYLSHNYIEKVDVSAFLNLPELTHVHLDYNLITQMEPHTFEGNHKLWKLILNENNLTVPEHTGFLNIPSLGWLELENCNVSYLPDNVFKNMSKLVVIRLSNNRIQKLHSEWFSHLKNLRYLHLEGNQIKEIGPDMFKNNQKLEWLYLRNNPLNQTQFTRHNFLHASSLISLDVSFCNISQISNKCFSNLHNLLNLKLNNNMLKSFNMAQIPRNLEVLDISGNSLTTIIATKKITTQMTNIKHLVLTHNKFMCDCHIFDIWFWCSTLRNASEGSSSCDDFCPAANIMACGKHHSQTDQARNISEHFSVKKPGRNHKYTNTSSEEIGYSYETNDNQHLNEVETVDGLNVDTEDGANGKHGKYKVKDKSVSSDLESSTENEQLEKVWGIVLYSCIGIFGGICLIGALALGTEMFLGYRRSGRSHSAGSSMRHVKLELMDTNQDREEMRPLAHNQGFDFVSMPTNANRTAQPGSPKCGSTKPEGRSTEL